MVGVSGIRSIKVAYRVIEIRRGAIVARPGQPSADLVGYGKDARHVPAVSPLVPRALLR